MISLEDMYIRNDDELWQLKPLVNSMENDLTILLAYFQQIESEMPIIQF